MAAEVPLRRLLIRRVDIAVLIIGFLFGLVGALWSYLAVDRLSREHSALAGQHGVIDQHIDAIKTASNTYFIANQQGDLIFILGTQNPSEVAALVYKGNMLDRAVPVRDMLGELALQGQLDYRTEYAAYEALNTKALHEFSMANFTGLKRAEQAIIERGAARLPVLLDQSATLDRRLAENTSSQERNRLIGLIASSLGSLLLLAANVIAKLGVKAPARHAGRGPTARDAERDPAEPSRGPSTTED